MFLKEIDNKFYKGYLIVKEKDLDNNKISYYIPKLKIGFNKYKDVKSYIDNVIATGNDNLRGV